MAEQHHELNDTNHTLPDGASGTRLVHNDMCAGTACCAGQQTAPTRIPHSLQQVSGVSKTFRCVTTSSSLHMLSSAVKSLIEPLLCPLKATSRSYGLKPRLKLLSHDYFSLVSWAAILDCDWCALILTFPSCWDSRDTAAIREFTGPTVEFAAAAAENPHGIHLCPAARAARGVRV